MVAERTTHDGRPFLEATVSAAEADWLGHVSEWDDELAEAGFDLKATGLGRPIVLTSEKDGSITVRQKLSGGA